MTKEREKIVRDTLKNARCIVVKVGSRALSARPDLHHLLAEQFAQLKKQGCSVILISSGAVALGSERLGYTERPTERSQLQAAASAGQSLLMWRYDEAFRKEGIVSAQILITHGDLSNRNRVNNARHALATLLDAGAIPIINQNDAIATRELSFGDNDQLSAMVTPLVNADALVLLTDVDGVLDPEGKRISCLCDPDDFIDQGDRAGYGSGGMKSKLNAAWKARRAGAAVVIANAFEKSILTRVLAGEDVGTCFPSVGNELRARQHWIAYVLRPRGTILLDEGAKEALTQNGGSLLPVGVIGLKGDFRRGDSVRLTSLKGKVVGHGLARLSALEVARVAGKKGPQLVDILGSETDSVVIHRDDLVLS